MTITTFQTEPSETRFSDWLLRGAEPAWSQAVGHRFTRELADDSLSDAVYRWYLLQDYAFIDALVRVVAYAIAKAPDRPAQARLAGFLAAVTSEENDYFLRSFEALGVAEADWRGAALGPVTRELGEIMLAAARDGAYEDALAVLLPAEWVYLSWAGAVADRTPYCPPGRFYLREWIELHVNPDFAAFVAWLREEIDRRGAALPEAGQRRAADLFRRMADLEVAFFEAAYED